MNFWQLKQYILSKICFKSREGRWTSPTPGTGSTWLWLLRSRPDQITKPPCEEARPMTFYFHLLVE